MAMVFMDNKESNSPVIFANDSFLSLTGFDRNEVLGQSFDALCGGHADPATLAQIKATFVDGSENDLEICFRRKDGTTFWAAVFISPVRDKNEDVVQYFASFVDVTQHIQEKEHLRFNLGQGAGMAIYNARELAEELQHESDLGVALARWEQKYFPFTQHVQNWSVGWEHFMHRWPLALEPLRSKIVLAIAKFPPTKRHWRNLYRGRKGA
jgi:PAS domain S-box-containing protein